MKPSSRGVATGMRMTSVTVPDQDLQRGPQRPWTPGLGHTAQPRPSRQDAGPQAQAFLEERTWGAQGRAEPSELCPESVVRPQPCEALELPGGAYSGQEGRCAGSKQQKTCPVSPGGSGPGMGQHRCH